MTLAGLHAPVEVRFDTFAVPHIAAHSDADAWRAVGYLQARDRLWQMELYRRAASGRLSELLGDATVAIDARFRTLGLRLAAEREWAHLAPRVRTAFEDYAAGVNAAMSAGRGRLPLEHQLLRLDPEPWTPADSLSISKLFAWRLGENHAAEGLRHELLQELGTRALELFPPPPIESPAVVEPAAAPAGAETAAQARVAPVAGVAAPGLEWLTSGHRAMSNAWAVHGSRTASGRPLLANDPHLVIELPSVWWEVHVESDARHVSGVTIPGIPFVVIGHNARVGWGLTNVGADVQDFFIERLDPTRRQYKVGDEWVPLEVRREEIRVRGRDEPLVFEVRSTRHGPVLNPGQWREVRPGDAIGDEPLEEMVFALKWDTILEAGSAEAFEALARAGNWEEFLSAVRRFAAPAQNFVYADVDGNIGYALSGLLPIRSGTDGALPTPGWPRDADWQGWVDLTGYPAVLNPPSGQIVTANNEVDRTFPHTVTVDWVAPFRATRIAELLGSRRGLDIDAMRAIQSDITSVAADRLLRALVLPDAVASLRTWDRRADDGPEALLYEAFEEALWHETFADEMPARLYERFYLYTADERLAGLHAIVGDRRSPWWDDRSTPDTVETRDQIVQRAAEVAVATLRARFGEPFSWRWDIAHGLTFSHPLSGGGRLLAWFFSRGPVPVVGNGTTVNKTVPDRRWPYATVEAASYRQILDVGAWDRSVGVNTAGQSGHPRSPHYFDQNTMWRTGRYRPLPFTREAVEAAAVSQLTLVP